MNENDFKKGGKAFLIVGATGTGKTTFVKDRIKNVNPDALIIYDINAEYDTKIPLMDIEEFTDKIMDVNNAVIVFEEAAVFFGVKGNDKKMRRILGLKRHRKNVIFLNFYSLGDVPQYIYRLSNYIVLFKTGDMGTIWQKYNDPAIETAWNAVRSSNDPHYYEIHKIY